MTKNNIDIFKRMSTTKNQSPNIHTYNFGNVFLLNHNVIPPYMIHQIFTNKLFIFGRRIK